jgi:hypothetical protein
MAQNAWSPPTRRELPVILIRGFGGLNVDEAKKVAYQGFNDGTVYPRKRGENYIYEGLVLRFLKSRYGYQDATNVVGYYSSPITDQVQPDQLPPELQDIDPSFFSGRIVIDVGMARHLLRDVADPARTVWVFRYYDLDDRNIRVYGDALMRVIDFIGALARQKGATSAQKVNIIAHSLGGLVVREAVQASYPERISKWQQDGATGAQPASADDAINKIVTLGTPHKGISFDIIQNWIGQAADELNHFDPDYQKNAANADSYLHFAEHFPVDRLLTVVGTNYHTYGVEAASLLNRLFSIPGEYGLNYNRSDGLVKQDSAQIPGAPRTFVHKCHGGVDSLVTSREAFEVATRFFLGNVRVRLRLLRAQITRGFDLFGKSEFYFGVSIKPRYIDFELFHQSPDAENCYGPFSTADMNDSPVTFDWAGDNRLIWEGQLDVRSILNDPENTTKDAVIRAEFYLGERDLFGIGFSDNVIFHQQYYLRAVLLPDQPVTMFLHEDEQFQTDPTSGVPLATTPAGWQFDVSGSGFTATFGVELAIVPEDGWPAPLLPQP